MNYLTPMNLKISPLPQEIDSYILSLLQSLPEKTQQLEKLKTSKIGHGIAGASSYKISSWDTTPFLDNFSKRQRTIILSAFGQAVRDRHFTRGNGKPLASATVKTAVDNISQTFRDYDRFDPRHDHEGNLSRILQQQFKGYKEKDPKQKHQKAIPLKLLRFAHESSKTPFVQSLSMLLIGAIFFCMRSCEYLKVPAQEDRKTKLLKLKNIRFFKNGKELPHNHLNLNSADVVSITYEDQKNRDKFNTVHLHKSKDPLLCPVKAWAHIVQRIRSYPGSTRNTPVNTFFINNELQQFKSKDAIDLLRASAEALSEKELGFTKEEIGTHSIRSGGAMAMYLAGIQVYTIQLTGRWLSDAFLRYIRKQVLQFSENISDRMVDQEKFLHIPEYAISSPSKNQNGR
mmetsp:Transcript_4792/g.6205  ORF Transcript_4792/g.6205 Transcript_4792/m.6205 type:complete len:400 (+) Transcript_4792:13-1212(+)